MTVLVVAPAGDSAEILPPLIEAMGHEVVVAADGIGAWELIRHLHFDLVFSDWTVPGLNGQELCRRIRAMPWRHYTYIIGLAARDGKGELLDALAAGADDFLTKPFGTAELVARLGIAHRSVGMQRELKGKTDALRALATTDELTGLKNRRQFLEDLNSHFAQADLGQSPSSIAHQDQSTRKWTPLSLILLDVDHFKEYNDAFGHPAGDDVLRGVAEVLHGGSRDYDTVARHGGEEFAVLLPDTDLVVATGMAERLRDGFVRRHWPYRPVTASFGVATMTVGAFRAEDLLNQADHALYDSKRGGRNRVTQFVGPGGEPSAQSPAAPGSQSDTVPPQPDGSERPPTCDELVDGWAQALALHDRETVAHCRRVTARVVDLARALGIDEAQMPHIRRGAMLHDIGKLGVPDAILLKPGPLTEGEWAVMRRHPQYAYDLLSPVPSLRPALDIPYAHHERWDGGGYPRGLEGERIPLAARAFAAVDVWDALSHDRPYREAWPAGRVNAHITALAGTHLDPAVVTALHRTLESG